MRGGDYGPGMGGFDRWSVATLAVVAAIALAVLGLVRIIGGG